MNDETYWVKRNEYLMNKKPERYRLHDIGIGFIVHDTLAYKYDNEKSGYHLIPEMNGGIREGEKSAQDLVEELNRLDFQVNGGLYDEYYHILSNKDRIHTYINNRLDDILNHLTVSESFNIEFYDYINHSDVVNIEVKVTRKGFEEAQEKNPIFEGLVFNHFFKVINQYLDEVEDSSDRDDNIREDTLVELKMRLLSNPKEFFKGLRG